ncbi:MAG: peptidase [Paenibacillaceae bacterium]|jgi:S1-C subfamily serine protease|nr:peptidase [Paenibacillaceae bacterium]
MDNQNKKDYSDFFNSSDEERNGEREEKTQERPSYYYSYGPYKSSVQDDASQNKPSSHHPDLTNDSVEVSPPRPVKPYPYAADSREAPEQQTTAHWRVNEPRRRSSARSMFAAFMAGALVVSTLMFASDRMNLFSGGESASSTTNASGTVASNNSGASSSSGAIREAALDISRPGTVSSIVQQASPAVVKIESYVTTSQRSNSFGSSDDFFRYFFGDSYGGSQRQQQPQEKQKVQSGMGTGFIFEKSGYILTNQHVIEGAEEILVTVEGYEEPFTAKLLGNSFELDLAVLKIEPATDGGSTKDFAILPIGDSSSMQIGDWLVAIGNPYGFEHTVTVGVLSAKEREISIPETSGTRNYKHLLQTDASINPGNSGGPLLNMNGEVVGINTAVNAEAQGIGFAIPTSTISEVLDSLKNNVEIPKEPIPYIGATLSSLKDVSDADKKELKLEGVEGVIVVSVELGQPAFRAGIKSYDVITAIDGTAVTTKEDLITKVQAKKVGDKAAFSIIRDGQKLTVDVTVGNKNDYAAGNQ